jgi:hypothetical protein
VRREHRKRLSHTAEVMRKAQGDLEEVGEDCRRVVPRQMRNASSTACRVLRVMTMDIVSVAQEEEKARETTIVGTDIIPTTKHLH